MDSALPVKDILDTAVGSAFANIFEAVAIVALFAAVVMLQLTGIRVLWSQARDGQIPAASWMRKVSKQRIPINATLTIAAISVVFALWSSLLSVLAAMTALAWGLAYGVVVTVGLYGLLKKKLPDHPWHYGNVQPARSSCWPSSGRWSCAPCWCTPTRCTSGSACWPSSPPAAPST